MIRLKKASAFFLILILLLAAWQHSLILYGFSQLRGQLKIIAAVQPIEDVKADPGIPQQWKEKLKLLDKIRLFAADSLKLNVSDNYTTFYNQHDKPVLWVLTGCLPYRLEAKTWWFPLIGNVTYKGFFDQPNGERAKQELIAEGYEAELSPTSAWSTLGWFKDPILSNMLKKGDGTFAELIIHELTHATVFLKSNVDFNENLATFIGEESALLFLKTMFTDTSAQYIRYVQYKKDEEIYGRYMVNSTTRLDSLYKSFNDVMPEPDKAREKKNLIRKIMAGIDSLPLHNKERYSFDFKTDSLPGNTFFMENKRYRKSQEKFEERFVKDFNRNLMLFISYIKETDPEVLIRELE